MQLATRHTTRRLDDRLHRSPEPQRQTRKQIWVSKQPLLLPPNASPSIPTGTSPAPTTNTLDRLALLQLRPRHPTDTRAVEIRLLGLNTPQTAQLLIPLLLPLCNQRRVGVVVLE